MITSAPMYSNPLFESFVKSDNFQGPIKEVKFRYEIKVTRIFSRDFNFINQTVVHTETGFFTQSELQARIGALYQQYPSQHTNGTGFGYLVSYSNLPLISSL